MWLSSALQTSVVFLTGGLLYYNMKMREDVLSEKRIAAQADIAVKKLKKMKFPMFEKPCPFVHRESLKRNLDTLVDQDLYHTVVVSGARGCGKSILVEETFAGRIGMHVYTDAAKVIEGIVRCLVSTYYADQAFLNNVLKEFKKSMPKDEKPPLIVVDVDEHWTDKEVENLLTLGKKFSNNLKLCKFIVVLSARFESYSLAISRNALQLVSGHRAEQISSYQSY